MHACRQAGRGHRRPVDARQHTVPVRGACMSIARAALRLRVSSWDGLRELAPWRCPCSSRWGRWPAAPPGCRPAPSWTGPWSSRTASCSSPSRCPGTCACRAMQYNNAFRHLYTAYIYTCTEMILSIIYGEERSCSKQHNRTYGLDLIPSLITRRWRRSCSSGSSRRWWSRSRRRRSGTRCRAWSRWSRRSCRRAAPACPPPPAASARWSWTWWTGSSASTWAPGTWACTRRSRPSPTPSSPACIAIECIIYYLIICHNKQQHLQPLAKYTFIRRRRNTLSSARSLTMFAGFALSPQPGRARRWRRARRGRRRGGRCAMAMAIAPRRGKQRFSRPGSGGREGSRRNIGNGTWGRPAPCHHVRRRGRARLTNQARPLLRAVRGR